jgi:hypothetical protein
VLFALYFTFPHFSRHTFSTLPLFFVKINIPAAAVVLAERDPRMAGRTQRHKVFGVVRTAFGERFDVVDFLRRGKPSVPFALFAQRVRCDVAVTDTLPRPAVAFAFRPLASSALISWISVSKMSSANCLAWSLLRVMVFMFVDSCYVFGRVKKLYNHPCLS